METGTTLSTSPKKQQKTNWLASFAGLFLIFVLVPLLVLQYWDIYIAVAIVGSSLLLVWNWRKTKTIDRLEILTLIFGLTNAVLFFGFHNLFLLTRLGCVIYTLLLWQVVYTWLKGEPWTEQYAKRSVSLEVQQDPLFHETNRFLTIVWGCCFVINDVISFVGTGLWFTIIPLALLALTAGGTPALTALYLRTKKRA